MYCAKTMVLGRLLMINYPKKLVSALPSGTVLEDVPSLSVVSGVAN